MSEEKKCSKDNRCSDCQNWLKEKSASCEEWEVKRKESYQKFELRFCPNQSSNRDRKDEVRHPETGGYSYLACPHGCKKMGIKKNDFGDQTELEHDCKVDNQIKSNQIKSNQIKSNQIKSNQSVGNDKPNYLPYILGGVGLVSLIGIIVYFLTRNGNDTKNK